MIEEKYLLKRKQAATPQYSFSRTPHRFRNKGLISDPYEKKLIKEAFLSDWFKTGSKHVAQEQIQAYKYIPESYGYGLGSIDIKTSDKVLGGTTKTGFSIGSKRVKTSEVSRSDLFSAEKDNFSPVHFQQHQITYPVHTEQPDQPATTLTDNYKFENIPES